MLFSLGDKEMRAIFKKFVVPLLVGEAVLIIAIAFVYLLTRRTPFSPEGRRFMHLAFMIGALIVLVCWPICRLFPRVPGTLVGLALGFVTPAAAGWVWDSLVDYFQYYSFGSWARNWAVEPGWAYPVAVLTLSVPGGIAGAVVGFLQAKRASRRPSEPSTRGVSP
jgi:hypothetical protein